MSSLFAEHALLPDGWARAVRLSIDGGGQITRVEIGAQPGEAARAAGPVLPGLPDLHSHAFQRAMAGLAESRSAGRGDDFWTWREAMYRLVERLGPEQIGAVAAWLYAELLCSGFTSVAEFHYLHHAPDGQPYADPAETSVAVIDAARTAGIGITHLPVLYARGGFGGEPLGAAQRRFATTADSITAIGEALRSRFAGDPGVRIGLAPHSLRAASSEEIGRAVAAAHATDEHAPIHIHVAEQTAEVEGCVAATGRRPVELLLDQHDVDARWCLVHATHMTTDESRRAAATGAVAGLCPTTEANLGDGLFDLPRWLERGGRFGVGTDSQVGRSATAELRWLEYGQRLALRRRAIAASAARPSVGRTLWEGALLGGAAALGQPIAGLAPGQRADLLVLDGDAPDLAHLSGDALLDAFVFSGGQSCISDVMVGGRWVVERGRHRRHAVIEGAYRRALAGLRT